MGDNLEDKIMEKKISFSMKDLKWVISTLVVIVGWSITAVLWVQDKNKQRSRIEVLETKNSSLEIQVATLNGQISGVMNATDLFMKNPPQETKIRIDLMDQRVTKLEEVNGLQFTKKIESTSVPIKRSR
jgi:hypothetical protein